MLNFRHRTPQYSPSCRSSSQRKLTSGCEPGFGLIQLCECFERLSRTAIVSRREWLRTVKVNIELMFESKVFTTKYLTLYTKSEHTALKVTQTDLNSKQPSQCRIQYCDSIVLPLFRYLGPFACITLPPLIYKHCEYQSFEYSQVYGETQTLPPVHPIPPHCPQ